MLALREWGALCHDLPVLRRRGADAESLFRPAYLALGWWGLISVFATPVVLIIDIVNYFRAWSLAPVPRGATAPVLTEEAIQRIGPLAGDLVRRLNANEPLERVATDIAARAPVTPGQVVRYMQALIAQQKAGQK